MLYLTKLEQYYKEGKLPKDLKDTLQNFYDTYVEAALSNGWDKQQFEGTLIQYLDLVIDQVSQPAKFEPYHEHLTTPIDYYRLGLDFIRPIVVLRDSYVNHLHQVDQIATQIAKGDNVVLFANHQTELDPQAISLLLEKSHPYIAREMIFIAGHRVVSDPLAVPLSKGRNLLCIFSKKYISDSADLKPERLMHNQRTMIKMSQLLAEGGKCIYVAPSGGRDRPNKHGDLEVALFDPQSIEMFYLMSQRAGKPTHFYPLALATYHLLPPPDSVKKKLGEPRHTQATAIRLSFGPEIDMEGLPDADHLDRTHKRKVRAQHIWELVKKDYEEIKIS